MLMFYIRDVLFGDPVADVSNAVPRSGQHWKAPPFVFISLIIVFQRLTTHLQFRSYIE